MTRVGCVIPAAGSGERLGGGIPKALRLLAGATLLEHSIRAVAGCRAVTDIVIAAPERHLDDVAAMAATIDVAATVIVVEGGLSRVESVRSGVSALPSSVAAILVHDAARPLVPVEVVEAVTATVLAGALAVVPAIPVADTVKRIDEAGRVIETIDRSWLRAIQTPQGFAADVLRAALAVDDPGTATDDAGLVERMGVPVLVIPGSEEALKVTRPFDLQIAETIVRRRAGRVH